MHSISIQANVQEDVSRAEELKGEEVVAHSGVTMSCLRNGCIDSVESAKIYLEVMLHNSIPHIINRTNTHVIIDNRLVYNTNLIWAAGGEKKLLNKHWGFINQAVTEHNLIPSNTPIKFIGLNLPPENYQDSRLNKSAINELYAIMVSKASAHNNNAIMMFLNILKDNKDKLNNYSGERGYHLGFVVEYLCSKLGIPYSEGCKSNKD